MKDPISEITALGLVDWQGIETKITRKGKEKRVLTGIPSKAFWSLWKRVKATGDNRAWSNAGILLFCYARRQGTGEYVTRKGQKIEIKRSEWEVQIWLNRFNGPQLAEIGFDTGLPDLEAPSTQAIKEEEFADCPF